MRKLYYSTCSIAAPHIGVVIDDILLNKNSNNEIFWAYCNCALSSCFKNLNGHKCICNFCHKMYKSYFREYGKGVTILPIDKKRIVEKDHSWDTESVHAIKSIVYRNVYVGNSILSLYFSFTRDLDVVNFKGFKSFALPLINEICGFVDYVYDLVDKIKPDEIIIYNGRLYENRLFYDIASTLKIKFKALEVVGGNVEPYKKVSFKGGLPHSITLNTQKIEKLWSSSPLSDEQKINIASSFYSRRRNGDLVADVAVYTASQKKNALPIDFDKKKRNIAIFNSSQDEIAALGGEWEIGKLFSTQYEAIEYVLKNADPKIHFYLRIHPNLRGVKHKEHLDLYKLEKYNNISVISPESKVSTYALLDCCEKVVVFGSTMGIEATFWGKPSIMLGRSLYENLDVCYKLDNKEQLLSFLNNPYLTPKDKLGALKYSYYLLDREFKVDKNIIDIDVKVRKLRWNFAFTSYFKLFGSQYLYQIAYLYYYILLPKFSKKTHCFPW